MTTFILGAAFGAAVIGLFFYAYVADYRNGRGHG